MLLHPAAVLKIVLIPVGMNEGDLAQHPVIYELLSENPVRPASLLGAGLHHAVGLLHGLHHLDAFGDGMHDRLFTVSILAGVHGVDKHLFVPMVRSGDENGIYVLAVEHLAVVGMHLGLTSRYFLRAQTVGLVYVA